VILIGPVIFTKITNVAIINLIYSRLDVYYHIIFTLNQAEYCIIIEYIVLGGLNSKLDIIRNKCSMRLTIMRNIVFCAYSMEYIYK